METCISRECGYKISTTKYHRDLTAKYLNSFDELTPFYNDCIKHVPQKPKDHISDSVVYSAYTDYHDNNNKKISKSRLNEFLKSKGCIISKSGGNRYYYRGIQLINKNDIPHEDKFTDTEQGSESDGNDENDELSEQEATTSSYDSDDSSDDSY